MCCTIFSLGTHNPLFFFFPTFVKITGRGNSSVPQENNNARAVIITALLRVETIGSAGDCGILE